MIPYPVQVYVDYLKPRMTGVRIASKVPANRPESLVTITTAPAGGHRKPDVLSWRRLIFKARHADEATAAALCETVRDHVLASRFAHIGVRVVNIIGEPAIVYDPEDGSPIGQFTTDVLMRATP